MMRRELTALVIIIISAVIFLAYMNDFIHGRNGNIWKRTGLLLGHGLGTDSDANGNAWRQIDFKKSKDDVLVFLHIQKTGGTILEKKMLTGIADFGCNCEERARWIGKLRCDCLRHNGHPWIVIRYTNMSENQSWPCGLHPDLTSLKKCVPKLFQKKHFKPNFLYFTQLRNPIDRYVSEFRHVQRGFGWKKAVMKCKAKLDDSNNNGCFDGESRENVTIERFLKCERNIGNNRQTLMLADLDSADCADYPYMLIRNSGDRLLESAMKNLKGMAYFGLVERPAESQFIFENTFNLKFKKDWFMLDTGYAKEYMRNISKMEIQKIKAANYLDIKLYKFAEKLFAKRLEILKIKTSQLPKRNKIKKHKKGKETLKDNWKRKSMMGKRWKGKNKRKKSRKKSRLRQKKAEKSLNL